MMESFRIGVKRAFDLYSRGLKDRVIKERLERNWEPGHRDALVSATRKLEEFDSKNPEPLTGSKKLEKDDLESTLEMLNLMDKKARESDPGPIYDVVLFHDGQYWTCIVDTSETGDLENGLKLRSFRETGDYGPLTQVDKLNVSMNVFDGGDVLQIVGVCSSHGTHVASIAAAHYPEIPEQNGMAPGAQIVSITIGDGRLSSMETGTALARAASHIMRAEHYKVDVINMSYGEHSHWSSTGRIGSLMGEVINKHGVIWFVSAGNDGPALSTVGTPPDIATNSVIGKNSLERPTLGRAGARLWTETGAYVFVRPCTLKCTQLMNGTSMASPNACGASASILSGLKQKGRALANTASFIEGHCPYAQGNGLIQVEKVFEHVVEHNQNEERDVRFSVSCNSGAKGIHLRDVNANKASEYTVKITPILLDQENQPADRKIKFNLKLAFLCDALWVKCPKHLDLMYDGRHIVLHVDPTGLPPGPHSAYVKAYNTQRIDQGCLFEIPLTVIRTEPLKDFPRPCIELKDVAFKPGFIKRHFLSVPEHATWAVINVYSAEKAVSGKLFFTHVRVMENQKVVTLSETGDFSTGISVKGGFTLEVCLAKFWSNLGSINVSYSITFYGVKCDSKDIMMHGGEGIHRFQISSELHDEEIKLKNTVQVVRPSDSSISPLKERDILPNNITIYGLELVYNFSIHKAGEITPDIPMLSNVLYESEFESQFWMLFDSNKQVIATGDAYPSHWSAKLHSSSLLIFLYQVEKGDYVLKAHVRHEKKEILEKMTDLNILLSQKLSSPVSLDVHISHANASTMGKKVTSFNLPAHKKLPLFICPLNSDKYVKHLSGLGQYLSGTMTLAKDEIGKKCDVYNFKYIIPELPKKDKKTSDARKPKSDKPSTSETDGNDNLAQKKIDEYNESLRDFKVGWLAKLESSSEVHKSLYEELLKTEVGGLSNLQVKFAHLHVIEQILAALNSDEILVHMATKHDYSANAAEQKKEIEKKKTIYIETLSIKGATLLEKDLLLEATEVLFELSKFADATDSRIASFSFKHADKSAQYGRALKIQLKIFEEKASPDNYDKIIETLKKLSWDHATRHFSLTRPIKFPAQYELF
ncbi:Uncharacterized protein FKW44_018993, partial [Caligus rogercresseyi]